MNAQNSMAPRWDDGLPYFALDIVMNLSGLAGSKGMGITLFCDGIAGFYTNISDIYLGGNGIMCRTIINT